MVWIRYSIYFYCPPVQLSFYSDVLEWFAYTRRHGFDSRIGTYESFYFEESLIDGA